MRSTHIQQHEHALYRASNTTEHSLGAQGRTKLYKQINFLQQRRMSPAGGIKALWFSCASHHVYSGSSSNGTKPLYPISCLSRLRPPPHATKKGVLPHNPAPLSTSTPIRPKNPSRLDGGHLAPHTYGPFAIRNRAPPRARLLACTRQQTRPKRMMRRLVVASPLGAMPAQPRWRDKLIV